MRVVIESPTPISEARRLLANVVVREALGGLTKHVESARFRFPVTAHVGRGAQGDERARCELEVRLVGGAMLTAPGVAANMADSFELAAHEMRRMMFAELRLPLPARSQDDAGGSEVNADRRAS